MVTYFTTRKSSSRATTKSQFLPCHSLQRSFDGPAESSDPSSLASRLRLAVTSEVGVGAAVLISWVAANFSHE
jgi:hypothetical protein